MNPVIIPGVAVLSMEQYLWRICNPIVGVGDYVKTGEVIARSGDKRVPPVHSSVSGTVKEIADRPHPFGHRVKSVIIESDGKDTWVDLSTDGELQDIILEKGIVETYDIHRPLLTKGTDTVILNGTDHQPYVFVDRAIIQEEKIEVIKGLQILMEALGAKRGRPQARRSMSFL